MSKNGTDIEIPTEAARRLILHLQGLDMEPNRKLDRTALNSLVGRMGFVQVDSINRVERAHHMILHSRTTSYRPERLRRGVEKEADFFENWTHDAAIVPMDLYPYWRHRFLRDRDRLLNKYRKWHGPGFEKELDTIIDRIETHGSVMARELGEKRDVKGQWWDWHPSKTALEFLWRTGVLAIARREGFQKVYDLSTRVIPDSVRDLDVDHADFIDWCCRSALDRLGFGTAGEIAGFWHHITTEEAKSWCEDNLGRAVVPCAVSQADGRIRRLYARPDIEEVLAEDHDLPKRVRLLNPFDPVLRDRKRLNGLFDFGYRIEVFVPAPQRKYGYYVFPVLEGDRLIGRADIHADRNADVLNITAFWPEPSARIGRVRMGRGRRAGVEAEFVRMAKLAGVSDIRYARDWLRDPAA